MNLARLFRNPIPTHFDEAKTVAAASFLLQNASGKKMKFIRLLKLLYMADREAWGRFGRPITGDSYVSMDQGPVLSCTYDLIKEKKDSPAWRAAVARDGFEVILQGEPNYGPLSEDEIEILGSIHERFRKIKTWDLIEHLHTVLKEWTNPEGTSITIEPDDILKALGKSDRIKAVRKDMEEYEAFRRLLTS